MSNQGIDVVIFEGVEAGSLVEAVVNRVRQAALLDNLEKLSRVEQVARIYLATNDPELARLARSAGVIVLQNSLPRGSFHFGREMKKMVLDHGLHKVFYFSGAGCPLITEAELSDIGKRLLKNESFLYTNNTQSADLVAFSVTDRFSEIELPDSMDNSLAMTLRDRLGLEQELMPQSPGLMFDIDTPADILVLGAGPFGGPRTRAVLESLELDYARLKRAKQVLSGYYQDVVLVGRVGAPVMERLNALLKLRLRVFSEERGMKALGRLASGQVVSLLGYLLEQVGLEAFFNFLPRVAECAFIDSRVLFAHYRFELTARERFLSDLGKWWEIEHPWLREFTRGAVECEIPVILGGHSLVAGSMWLLSCELEPASGPPGTAALG